MLWERREETEKAGSSKKKKPNYVITENDFAKELTIVENERGKLNQCYCWKDNC